MVKKTRRKQSAGKRVKTAKRRKNNTRSKRGRGGRGGRSAKRGGMNPAARVAARSAAAATKHAQRIHTPYGPLYGVVPKTISEQFIDKEKETTSNPVEMVITGKGVGDNMEKSAYNERRRELFKNQTPTRPHNPAYFSTPNMGTLLPDSSSRSRSRSRFNVYNTPAGQSIEQSSPPPPSADLSIRGNRLPYNPMDFADMAARNPIQKLDFGDEFETPESSPYRKSTSSLQKTFKKKPGQH